uniref:Secreted antigen 3 n=1 Tax=Babesia gibsoni TaxID=33632 RepID=C4TMT9_BABGI|nr:secreted antigen 3 [Babesia gibsoni]
MDMKGLGIIRLVALWSLAVNATIPIVQGASGVSVDAESIKPGTVKDAVDLLGKLATDETLKKTFIDELLNKVKEHLDLSEESQNEYKQNLGKLLSDMQKLRPHLLETPDDFGLYSSLDVPGVKKAVGTVARWLSSLHSEFWLLFFLTSTDGFVIGGSQWSERYFGPSNTDTNIQKWLTDKLGNLNMYILKKGYSDNHLKSDGRATIQFSGNLGIGYYSAGSLTQAQIGLFLLSSDVFHPSNLANSLLFMAEFCRGIKEEKFANKNEKYKNIKEACNELPENIDSLHKIVWPLYNHDGVTELEEEDDDDGESSNLMNKRNRLNKMYGGKLKSENFDYYVQFLKNSIPKISELLKIMHSDASGWSVEYLTTGQSYGPFKYGYVFKDNKWDTALYYTVKPYIVKLLDVNTKGSLYSLLECLDPEQANKEKEKLTELYDILTGKNNRGRPPKGVERRAGNPKGKTGMPSTEEVGRSANSEPRQSSDPQHQPQPQTTNEEVTGSGEPGARAPVKPAVNVDTSRGGEIRPESKLENEEEVEEESPRGDENSSELKNKAGGPKDTRNEGTPNVQHGGSVSGEASDRNARLRLARSAEGTEEAVPESPTSATPAVSASTSANEDPAKTGEASHDDQTPQKRRTHPQGDNAPKAIREEAELPSESSFSGIHACGILIATCIFTVV